jgi:uncharacterized protein YdhG (YjbR/CyaY superfamily)
MPARRDKSRTIEQYIARFPPGVQVILQRIRRTIRRAVPRAEETISYQIPAFKLHGIVLYFAAFQHHIGLFPPIRGNPALTRAAAPYANPKGNLRFPLDRPIPYTLIARIARFRALQNLDKAAAKTKKRP